MSLYSPKDPILIRIFPPVPRFPQTGENVPFVPALILPWIIVTKVTFTAGMVNVFVPAVPA
jgi:hypothetical protein